MRRATSSEREIRTRRRAGELDRAAIEARLGFRPSAVDDAPERRRLGLRDAALAAAVCIAASAPLLAPELDQDTRLALSWRSHLTDTGAIETATTPLAQPVGVAAAARAVRAKTPIWAEAKMDRQSPATPFPAAPEPEEIEVGGAMPGRAPKGGTRGGADGGERVALNADVGEIVTGVVLDGPIASGGSYALEGEGAAPLELDGPTDFPTATIDGPPPLQPYPGAAPVGLDSMPMFRPGQNPFEMNREQREALGIIDTGAVPLAAPKRAMRQPRRGAAAEPMATTEAPVVLRVLRSAAGGGLLIQELGHAARQAGAAMPPEQAAAELAAWMSKGRFARAGATPTDALPTDQPAPEGWGAELDASAYDEPTGPHPADATLDLALSSLGAAIEKGGVGDAATREAANAKAAIAEAANEEAAIEEAAIAEGAIETASLDPTIFDEDGPQAPDFAPRPIPDPRTRTVRRADRLAGFTTRASDVPAPGSDGATARSAEAGAAPTPAPKPAPKPTLSVVLTAVGLNTEASNAALARLPRAVAISIAPIAPESDDWARRALAQGRVVLAETPMEPESYPRVNPGPLTLLTANSVEENVRRLGETLARVPGAQGVATYLGDRFATNDMAAAMLAAALERRGIMLFETSPAPGRKLAPAAAAAGVPAFTAAVDIDRSGHAKDMASGLEELEAAARRDGYAIGVGVAIPSTVTTLETWLASLEGKGFVLKPLGPTRSGATAGADAGLAAVRN